MIQILTLAIALATAAPTVMQSTASPRRYVYTRGYYGTGYYDYAAPRAIYSQTPTRPMFVAPSTAANDYVGPLHRDWSSGREEPLAKPWLRPID